MSGIGRGELVLIRHAPADHEGRVAGRRDVPAILPGKGALAPLRAALAGCAVMASPARRCRETAAALFPGLGVEEDSRLWEQDFGVQEGISFADLPDLGPLPLSKLARHRPPGGESFVDMAARAAPALRALAARAESGGPVAVVAHAGTARAALGLALGEAALGLAFEIAPLSLTRLRPHGEGFSIIAVNQSGV